MTSPSSRRESVADGALALLAREGLRGLTHRAVDAEAGLPAGATSNVARTRAALLDLALHRVVELESAEFGAPGAPGAPGGADPADIPLPGTPEGLAAALAAIGHHLVTRRAARTRARMELALEAARRPELRAAYDRLGHSLRDPLRAVLADLGSAAPERHARSLVMWLEGLQFYCSAGTGAAEPPARAEIEADLRELIGPMLETPSAGV
ncbi:TetR/AcrR family transcriptional regulator [Mangrovactinospora gilvigrisea]|uniref:TetR/AcrR family transcriptional regulator n=1 Tax=Mangrovactinospora gilvigrisea TaxID=1428644 RepID=UPI001FE97818|nr:TetR/AcrR family transcriptional regulator [Mangrovactinospora gilvigrisea]